MAFLSGLALVLAISAAMATGWRRERQLRLWGFVLGPTACDELNAETRATRRQLDTIEDTYRLAKYRRQAGESQEAHRMLDLACATVEAYVPGRVERLRTLIRMSRAVSAMLPARRMPWTALRSRSLAAVVRLDRTLRILLVTTGERFRLHVRLIASAFSLLLKNLRRHTNSASQDAHSWTRIDDLCADLGVLSQETLECYRVVLASLERDWRLDHVASPIA